MGKKASGKTYVSKGERRSSISTSNSTVAEKMLNKARARAKGKDTVWTLENPNENETNKAYIRHPVSGKAWIDNLKNPGGKKSKK